MTIIAREAKALDRLGQLGISYEHVERALQRADAEAKLTNDLEPPTAEGVTRYNKTNRFLREELIPLGWDYDSYRNLCRTIHPERAFAIVASSGDEGTGVWIRGQNPSTKYLKGGATVRAVEANGQMAFDFGDDFVVEEEQPSGYEPMWYLLYRVTADQIFVELSFPSVIEGGRITDWIERIILDPIDRTPIAPTTGSESDEGDDQDYAVDVAMR